MVGYLPIPQSIAHEGPTEVILRFSTSPVSASTNPSNEVFLHAVGATAAFGQPFTPSDRPFTINAPPTILRHVDSDGCQPLAFDRTESPFIALLNRGGCTFLEKLVHASRAGAAGVIVAGFPPSTDMDQDGLLRPSAEGEGSAYIKEVEDKGMVYVDWRTGNVLRDVFQSSTGVVYVEVLGFDGQVALENERAEVDAERRLEGAGRASREGRVGIGEWPIWNLRIIDGT
jgi:mannosidase alpha-like ER degradation enhancer 1